MPAPYSPPLFDMNFLLEHVFPLSEIPNVEIDKEMAETILTEAAKLAVDVLDPLNWTGDRQGTKRHDDGSVETPKGFVEAYELYKNGGWNSVPFSPEFGGQGLPWLLSFPVQEMWQAANMSFGLCPLLNQGAVEALLHHGSAELQQKYLPKLISGEWTGTMNLTEPQAGSDLALLRAKAERGENNSYKIFGQKIYITFGEHDLAENIIHLVLARLPDAPAGVKGISLFLVPKFLEDGTRNDVVCTGIEHKLGIHASPTCTMQFGDKGGAIGWLIGAEHQGLQCMFTMMNNARLSVGLQGVAIAERSYSAALNYARERKQGIALSATSKQTSAIIEHEDVKRMLLLMRTKIESHRALAYYAAMMMDLGRKDITDILTPIVKSCGTDMAVEVTSLGVQIHGGMGFIEETGVAQYYRDARILPIYEGTNGIQANDFMFRKMLRDDGKTLLAFMDDCAAKLSSKHSAKILKEIENFKTVTQFLLNKKENLSELASIASAYLNYAGIVFGAVMMDMQAAHLNKITDENFKKLKAQSIDAYMALVLPEAQSYKTKIELAGELISKAEF